MKNKTLITWSIIIITFLVFVGTFFIYFNKHFMPGSKINGISVSLLNVDDAFDKIAIQSNEKVTLYENNVSNMVIMNQSFYHINYDKKIVQDLLNQNKYKIIDENYDFPFDVDEDILKNNLSSLNNNRAESKDAFINFNSNNFEYFIEQEKYGDYIDLKMLLSDIEKNADKTLGIQLENYYINPKVLSDDEMLNKQKDEFNEIYSSKIEYELLDNDTLILDKNTFGPWIELNGDELIINDESIENFVEKLASLVNTVGNTRTFETQNGTKNIVGGTYGWLLDKDKEKEFIKNAILDKTIIKRRPIFKQEAKVYSKNDIGNTYIEVDIDNQHMYLFENGEITLDSDVVTGMLPDKGRRTTTGTHFVFQKDKSRYLNGPTWHTFVNRFMPFHGGEGFHDATWRSSFGGEIYKHDGSHGCVNMPKQKAIELFDKIEVGVPVIVYSSNY